MIIKVLLTIIFLVVMVGVGIYSRKQASSVDGFVLGGRAVGPWLTAFASEPLISLPWSLWAMQDSSDGSMVFRLLGLVLVMPLSDLSWLGLS